MRSFPHRLAARCCLISALALLAAPPLAAAEEVRIRMKDLMFKPVTIEVKVGDKVTWVNEDESDHTVTAKDKSFKSGNIGTGKKYSRKFTKAGEVEYHCEYHPRMKGKIVVRD